MHRPWPVYYNGPWGKENPNGRAIEGKGLEVHWRNRLPLFMRLAGFVVCGERQIRKGNGGDEQRLATARDHEGRDRALVLALRGALRKTPSPRERAFHPPKTSGETCPCPLTRDE